VRSLLPLTLVCAVAIAAPRSARAQDEPAEEPAPSPAVAPFEPSPPQDPTFAPADPEVSDLDVIRWAARDVGRSEGRPPSARPPVPPDPYLHDPAHSGAEVVLPGEDERTVARLLAELGGGALGVLVGGGAGTLIIWAALESGANPDFVVIAVAGGTVLGSLALTAGVTLAADLTGGRGNFGHAFLGQIVGGVAALPFVVLGFQEGAPAAALVAVGLLPLAGAILGYELGHASGSGTVPTVQALAFLTPIEGGALVGVSGTLP
jgi:hypothetical protein